MTTYAKLMDYERGYFPAIIGIHPSEIDWFEEEFVCWQPEALDFEQYNLVLFCPKRKVFFLAQSFDFEYTTDRKQSFIKV